MESAMKRSPKAPPPPPYPAEFRERIVELARSGRSYESLSRELGPSGETIRNWVKQADLNEGRRSDGLTSAERAELNQLRRDVRRLEEEKEILKKAAAWFAQESNLTPPKRSGS
jgi:transposase